MLPPSSGWSEWRTGTGLTLVTLRPTLSVDLCDQGIQLCQCQSQSRFATVSQSVCKFVLELSPSGTHDQSFVWFCLSRGDLPVVRTVLSCNRSQSLSVLASSPVWVHDQIFAEVRQLRGWCHATSSLTRGRVCLLCSTLYWSLLHLTLSEVSFARPSTGVFFTLSFLESICSTLYWSLLHLTLSRVFFTWPSTGVFITWSSLESSSLSQTESELLATDSQPIGRSVLFPSVSLSCLHRWALGKRS
jgi:hypothetical protein